jgi:hypothetical protein
MKHWVATLTASTGTGKYGQGRDAAMVPGTVFYILENGNDRQSKRQTRIDLQAYSVVYAEHAIAQGAGKSGAASA